MTKQELSKLKVGDKVVIRGKKPEISYLTLGKHYEVTSINLPKAFSVIDNDGYTLLCLYQGCNHATPGEWEVVKPKKR